MSKTKSILLTLTAQVPRWHSPAVQTSRFSPNIMASAGADGPRPAPRDREQLKAFTRCNPAKKNKKPLEKNIMTTVVAQLQDFDF